MYLGSTSTIDAKGNRVEIEQSLKVGKATGAVKAE